MKYKSKNRRKKIKPLGVVLLVVVIILIIFLLLNLLPTLFVNSVTKVYYVSSNTNMVKLFEYDAEIKKIKESKDIYRGLKVESQDKTETIGDVLYQEITIDDSIYYINPTNLVKNDKEVVTEKEKYVRTSVTVYKNERDYKISSFVKKGAKLDVLGYDYINDKGIVNMYKIKKDDIEGWVYSKYLVDTEEEANKNYNENGVYDIHKDRKYSRELYGGKASTLDYYPYEKPAFKNNKLLEKAKSMYLNAGSNVISNIDKYLKIATENGVNAIVVDLKDGALAYPMEIAKEYSMTAYNTAINSFDDYKNAINKIKEANIYVIGRIVAFNDLHYGKDHPEDCINSPASYRQWPSVYSRNIWEYNVALAKQAIDDIGFNEIQYDYVRFPEDAYNMSRNSNTDFKNKYNEEKAEAVQNFIFYATDQIHKEEVYISIDVFGECSGNATDLKNNAYVTSYGQYWPAISNIVDVISSMPYTDHFGRNNNTWSNPYQTVNNWAKGAAKRQKEIPTPAIARTWITAYDTPFWNPTVVYDASKISAQAKALVDAGLDGGFITWNSASNLYKYDQIKEAFSKNY